MNRLSSELQRLYALPATHDEGVTRAMVIEVARPADWAVLSAVWQGVQVDLALPAPAIVVNGRDGFGLWFSLVDPVPLNQAMAFLEALSARYLSGLAPERLALLPLTQGSRPMQALQAFMDAGALEVTEDQWSAFVAPDLAPVFNDTPWLDLPPSQAGQADLLSRLDSIKTADFHRALVGLAPVAPPATPWQAGQALPEGRVYQDPRQFLLDVMNNEALDMAWRIEAAKALLPHIHPAGGTP